MLEDILNILSDLDIYGKSLTGLGANDVVDIFIIAFIMYKVMIWVKETRAWTLLKGFSVILAVSIASFLFNLYTVSWLIDKTLNVGLIAFFVIFQPELRKALEQIGNGKFISSLTLSNQSGTFLNARAREEIVRAVVALAYQKTGALIVIENKILLDDYDISGLRLDADISSQLLINIFQDKTPLHDGAVIIRQDKISSAMCILPLTQLDIDKELGTRHRAALGMSEVSDAVIIVVSEETGNISIASGASLTRFVTETELRAFLTVDSSEQKKKLIHWRGRHHEE